MPLRRDLAVLDRVDDLAAVPQAVAAGEEPGNARRAGGTIDDDPPSIALQVGQGGEQVQQRLLTERLDDHVGREHEIRSRHRPDPAGPRARILELGPDELDATGRVVRRR